MADTNFSDGVTVVQASWLNDVNDAIYSALGSGGVAPTTPTEVATNIGAVTAGSIHAGSSVSTPDDADELPILDSTSTFSLKKITWASITNTLKTYFDTIYTTTSAVATQITNALSAAIGSTIQAYDSATAKTNVAQTFSASQRGTLTTDNDGSFDQNVTNNFFCTLSGDATLTFTNHTAGQSGFVLLDNSGGHTVSAAATTKVDSSFLTTVSAAGVYLISYLDNGTNAYCVCSGALA